MPLIPHGDAPIPRLSIGDLRPSELRLANAMQQLGYGRFEFVPIHDGELILVPWPITVHTVKFGNATTNQPDAGPCEFELKKQVAEFFAQVRSIEAGVIRVLEVRGGLPFSMEVAEGPAI